VRPRGVWKMELLAQMRGGDGDPSHSRRGLNARIGESSEMSGGGAVIVAVTGRSSRSPPQSSFRHTTRRLEYVPYCQLSPVQRKHGTISSWLFATAVLTAPPRSSDLFLASTSWRLSALGSHMQ